MKKAEKKPPYFKKLGGEPCRWFQRNLAGIKLGNVVKLGIYEIKQEKSKKALDKEQKKCGEALKSELLFRRDAHEIYTEDSAWNATADDSKNEGESGEICKKAGAGLYAPSDADL